MYQGDNLAVDSVRPSHESLQEKLLVVIDKDALLKGLKSYIPEFVLLI